MDWVEPADLGAYDAANAMVVRLESETERLTTGTRVLAVTGSLDLFTASRFEAELLAALDGTEKALIIDLTECDFLDSGALAVMVRRHKLLDAAGPCLLFVAPQPSLLRVFALANVDHGFVIHPTLSAALASCQMLRQPREGAPTEDLATGPTAHGDRRSSMIDELISGVQEQLEQVEASGGGSDELLAGIWTPEKGMCVVALAGEMDMSTAPKLTHALDGCLGLGPCQLIVELSHLSFIDSSGINALVRLTKAVNATGGELLLAAPSPDVKRVFEIVQLGDVVTIVESLEAVLRLSDLHASSPGSSAQEHGPDSEEGTDPRNDAG